MIQINNLNFSYGNKKVLSNINLEIANGSLNAIVGTNGVGKSTLFRCLSKQQPVKKDVIYVKNKDINNYSYQSFAHIISLVPQLVNIRGNDIRVCDYMVEGRTPHLAFFSIPQKKDYLIVEKVAQQLELCSLLNERVSELSGGQQQLVSLGRAMVQDTPVILLDEPMSALDLSNQSKLLILFRKLSHQGKTIIFSTHNPNHALSLNCNTILLKNGSVMCYDVANSCITTQNLKSIYGNNVKCIDNDGELYCKLDLS